MEGSVGSMKNECNKTIDISGDALGIMASTIFAAIYLKGEDKNGQRIACTTALLLNDLMVQLIEDFGDDARTKD